MAGWVALWASLVDRSPLALIALNSKPRYLLLTVNELEPWVYYPFATFRLLATKPLVWLVGAWYGPRAMRWAEQRSERGGRVVWWMERHFGRFGGLIIFITSNNVVCLLAGSSGFPLGWFMVLAVVGTLLRLYLIDLLGEAFTRPIDQFIGWVETIACPSWRSASPSWWWACGGSAAAADRSSTSSPSSKRRWKMAPGRTLPMPTEGIEGDRRG